MFPPYLNQLIITQLIFDELPDLLNLHSPHFGILATDPLHELLKLALTLWLSLLRPQEVSERVQFSQLKFGVFQGQQFQHQIEVVVRSKVTLEKLK